MKTGALCDKLNVALICSVIDSHQRDHHSPNWNQWCGSGSLCTLQLAISLCHCYRICLAAGMYHTVHRQLECYLR